ncbi:MAG: LptF/LptG family permease [Beijerinckiaceae bacterium]|nr:LptF/LptG family permease [Beijerinckiaceae bacterium]MCI0737265.1 LptF/LptG family permease [Beijerinckiaceae bacterium]
MPRLLFFYFSKRIALASLLLATGLCVPVVMTSLFHHLPAAAIRGGLLMPALLGTFPTVVYIALPAAVGVAVALEFARMSADGMIAVLYSLRLSAWAISLPAAFIAIIAVAIGYWISSVFAPAYVGQMHDVIYVIRNSLNHRMLEPARFYTFDNGSRTIYFRRWISADAVSGMFIHQYSSEKNEEQIIVAAKAEFRRNEHGVVLIMSKGSIETILADGTAARTANFDDYAMPIGMQGSSGLPQRSWRGPFELTMRDFFRERPSPMMFPGPFAEWMSEGTKRFGVPLLALGHALLMIGLVLSLGSATGRAPAGALMATLAAVPVIHIVILVGAEALVRKDPRLVWLVGAAIVAELAAAIFLISRQDANFKLGNKAVQEAA